MPRGSVPCSYLATARRTAAVLHLCRLRRPSELSSCSRPKSRYTPWKDLPALSHLRSSVVCLGDVPESCLPKPHGKLQSVGVNQTLRMADESEGLYVTVGINKQMGHSWVMVNGKYAGLCQPWLAIASPPCSGPLSQLRHPATKTANLELQICKGSNLVVLDI